MKFFVYCFFFAFFGLLLFLWKRLYFRSVSVVKIDSGAASVVAVKPTLGWFRNNRSANSGFTSLGNGYIAWQFSSSEDERLTYSESFNFDSTVYIFRTKFGRLCSVNLSERCLSDVLKKFK